MSANISLQTYLRNWSAKSPKKIHLADIVERFSRASVVVSRAIARCPFADIQQFNPSVNADGDTQKPMDIFTNNTFIEHLKGAPIGAIASEENETEIVIDERSHLLVAMDPLDGSSNIDTNASIGSIFSVLDVSDDADSPGFAAGCYGSEQLLAGYFIYGPQTSLLLTLRNGTLLFVFDADVNDYVLVNPSVNIVDDTSEYYINASNYRFWEPAIRTYINDCIAGEAGPHGKNFNMRWTASLVAEAYRVMVRGGVYIYPADSRPGYGKGRLRLLYEAFPIALLVEQAGGAATDGLDRILDQRLEHIHQRVPLIFGSQDKVTHISRYYSQAPGAAHPLFKKRQLLRES